MCLKAATFASVEKKTHINIYHGLEQGDQRLVVELVTDHVNKEVEVKNRPAGLDLGNQNQDRRFLYGWVSLFSDVFINIYKILNFRLLKRD